VSSKEAALGGYKAVIELVGRASEFNIDSKKMSIYGSSSGGFMAVSVAQHLG